MLKSEHKMTTEEVFINLTPLIDILTCLLFFLLLGYKSQTIMIESANGLELPASSSEQGLVETLTLAISNTEIKLQDSTVMYLKQGAAPANELQGAKIVPLYNRMLRLLQTKNLDPKNSVVLLLADKRLKTEMVTNVMKTCGMAGFPNFYFGVAKP